MHKIINIPNSLSLLRIILSFVFAIALVYGHLMSAIVILFTAGITDFLDGYTARKLNLVSQFGAALDPLADKILMFVTYISFSIINLIPSYVAAVVIARDIMILLAVVGCICSQVQLKMAPIMSSKINTTIQITYLLFVLTCNYFQIHITSINECFTWLVVTTTIWSGVEYVQKYWWIGKAIFKQ